MGIVATFKMLKDRGFICDVTTGWCQKHQPDGYVLFINPFTCVAQMIDENWKIHKSWKIQSKNYGDTLKRVEDGLT